MALFERRSSGESFSQWGLNARPVSDRRKLSFNPTGQWSTPTNELTRQESLGAFEVSKPKRVAQVTLAVIYCLLAAGIIFGYAALKPVLVDQKVYRDRCTEQEIQDNVWVCYGQELRLNLMFTVAAVTTNVCALPVGTMLDRYGPRVCGLIGSFFLALGALSLGFASDLPFDAYIPGYLFFAIGGPFVFIPSFHLSNTFPQSSGLILALLTGAFDTSSALFLIYRLVYQLTGGAATPKKFFLGYLIVPAYILLVQLFFMPSQSYKTVGELVQQAEDDFEDIYRSEPDEEIRERRASVVSEITNLLGSKSGQHHTQQEERKAARSGVWGALHGYTALQQIRTPWFVLITLFTVIQMLRINYFVATIRTQYAELLHSLPQARRINEIFDVALPAGGIVAIPFIGFVLDYSSTTTVLSLLVGAATLIGIIGVIPTQPAAYANVILFVLYRPLFYTAVSDYAAKVFGFATFGKVYGLIVCLAGLFNFAQAGLETLTHRVFNDDPIPLNVLLSGIGLVIGSALVGYIWRKSVRMAREKLEVEAEGAQEALVPGADEERVNRDHGHESYGTA